MVAFPGYLLFAVLWSHLHLTGHGTSCVLVEVDCQGSWETRRKGKFYAVLISLLSSLLRVCVFALYTLLGFSPLFMWTSTMGKFWHRGLKPVHGHSSCSYYVVLWSCLWDSHPFFVPASVSRLSVWFAAHWRFWCFATLTCPSYWTGSLTTATLGHGWLWTVVSMLWHDVTARSKSLYRQYLQ